MLWKVVTPGERGEVVIAVLSIDRRGTDKPWSEHQEGLKVEKNNREINVWVDSEYRLCEKFSSDYEVGLEVSFTLLAYWLFSLSPKGNKATSNWLHQCQL